MIVGCPIYNRAWILPRWLEYTRSTLEPHGWIFVYTPGDDDTYPILKDWSKKHHVRILVHESGTHGTGRDWTNPARIETLAEMRNRLLDAAAEEDDLFMSLDSDVIPCSGSFRQHLIMDSWDIVGPTVALATDRTIINAFRGRRPDGYVVRAKPGHHGQVDVLCAAKYMVPEVVRTVRYGYHPRGEDFYFAAEAKKMGFVMGLCPDITEHWMTQGRDPIVPELKHEYRPIHA